MHLSTASSSCHHFYVMSMLRLLGLGFDRATVNIFMEHVLEQVVSQRASDSHVLVFSNQLFRHDSLGTGVVHSDVMKKKSCLFES